jgi:hypothetical protein
MRERAVRSRHRDIDQITTCSTNPMNTIELHEGLREKSGWLKFAENLEMVMTEEYRLDGVTVVLRETTAKEMLDGEDELLTFSQASQHFEFALRPGGKFPAPWKIADRIDDFLNPNVGGDG